MSSPSTVRYLGRQLVQRHSRHNPIGSTRYIRLQSSLVAPEARLELAAPAHEDTAPRPEVPAAVSPLRRLSTVDLVRNIALGAVFTSPALYKVGLALLSLIANSKYAVFNADKNIVLRTLLRPLVYNHFCAGVDATEVQQTVSKMKGMGCAGVILCYGKETIVDSSKPSSALEDAEQSSSVSSDESIRLWADGNLQTLKMIGAGDYIALKLTGAGPVVSKALSEGRNPPQQLKDAFDTLARTAAAQGSKIWVDAEQAVFQTTIDEWTIELMRKYNRNGEALISNTIQSYLKDSRANVTRHLRQAKEEGWTLGIKLVRGAYIAKDPRGLIHDTKAETDKCYDSTAEDLLTKRWPGFAQSSFPNVQLFLAGHNSESIRRASALSRDLVLRGQECDSVRYGQLQGMADDISCELLELGEQARNVDYLSQHEAELQGRTAPLCYKYLTWGSVQECMHYLVRRATENQGGVERLKSGMPDMHAELRRRIFAS